MSGNYVSVTKVDYDKANFLYDSFVPSKKFNKFFDHIKACYCFHRKTHYSDLMQLDSMYFYIVNNGNQ